LRGELYGQIVLCSLKNEKGETMDGEYELF
jgi:hypothetical protein